VALRERGQFSAVCGGLCPQLRRAEGKPMIVQNLKAAAASGQHSAWLGCGFGAQCLAEPAAYAGHRWTAPSAPSGRYKMTTRLIDAA
jgi:hypothetical protein